MSEENFCASCRGIQFDKHMKNALKDMRYEKDFSNVTLACGNDQILAHKVILAAYSPFFRDILKVHPHPHPLIYLKGAKYGDLQAIIDYMYMGNVNVLPRNINSFLALAKDLQIKGFEKAYNSRENDSSSVPTVYEKDTLMQKSAKEKSPQESSSNQESHRGQTDQKVAGGRTRSSFTSASGVKQGTPKRSRSSSAESRSPRGFDDHLQEDLFDEWSASGVKHGDVRSRSSVSPPSKFARQKAAGNLSDGNDEDDPSFTTVNGVKQDSEPRNRNIPPVLQEIMDAPRENEAECSIVSPPGSTATVSSDSIHTEDYGDATAEIRIQKKFIDEHLEDTEDGIICKICNKIFVAGRKFNAQRHVQFTHSGSEDVACQDCGLFFKNSRTLDNHKVGGHCPIAKKKI